MKPGKEEPMKLPGKDWKKLVKKQWMKLLIRTPEKQSPLTMLPEETLMMFSEDLLMEILVKLPINSLVRLSCVCKAWRNLITKNHYFSEKHLNNDNREGDPTMIFMGGNILLTRDIHKSLPAVSRISGLTDNTIGWHLASCNGILCSALCFLSPITLFNPITQQRLRLPEFEAGKCKMIDNLGFGFDAFSKDYKVVVIMGSLKSDDETKHHDHVRIYKLSTNSWSKLDANLKQYCYNYRIRGVFAKGFYYWPVRRMTDGIKKILTFDLKNEIFGEMEFPIPAESEDRCISVVDNSLAICTSSRHKNISVWVMRENGSWMRRFSVALPTNVSSIVTFWVHNMNLAIIGYDDHRKRLLMASFPNERKCKISSGFSCVYDPRLLTMLPPTGCIGRATLVSLRIEEEKKMEKKKTHR